MSFSCLFAHIFLCIFIIMELLAVESVVGRHTYLAQKEGEGGCEAVIVVECGELEDLRD